MEEIQSVVVMIAMAAGSLTFVYMGLRDAKKGKKTAFPLIALAGSILALGVLLFVMTLGIVVSFPWVVAYTVTVGILVARNIHRAGKDSYRVFKQEEDR